MIQADQDTSFQAMRGRMRALSDIVQGDPGVEHVMAQVGGGGVTNTGRVFLSLKPKEKRNATPDQIIARLRGKLARVPGASLYLQPIQDIRIGGRLGNAQYQYTLQGDDAKELFQWAPRVLERMRGLRQLVDVNTDQQIMGLQATLVVDRATASRLGISAQLIDKTLYDAFGQDQVSTMYTSLNQYHVVMEVAPQYWQNPDSLKDIYIHSSTGAMVPLSAFAHYQMENAALAVNHQGQLPSVTITFNLPVGVALGDAVKAVEKAQEQIRLPASIRGSFMGTAQAFQASLANEPILIAAALVAVYVVLGVLYESLIHPVTILSTLPSAGVGALLALLVTPHRPERDRPHRHHPAHRHREEERHPDDRLRPGGGAAGGHHPRAGHLPGLPAALPAHHDDHHGRPAGRRAPGPGPGHRRPSCASPWASPSSAGWCSARCSPCSPPR